MRRALQWLALAAGLGLLGWYLSQLDWKAAGDAFRRLGWMAPLVLVPYFVVYMVDCLGWRLSFARNPPVPFWTLFRIRWSGEALNNVVPSAYIGGEALKVYLLRKRGVPASSGAASAVISKTAQTVGQLLFIVLASAIFLRLAGDQPGLRAGMSIVLAGGILAVAALFWAQRRGLLGMMMTLARVLHLKAGALESRRAKIEGIDRTILGFYRSHPRRFLASAGAYLCGWMLDTVEIMIVSRLLGMPVTWEQALCVEAFTGVAKALGMWSPGSVGVQESGIVLLGRMAGLPDALSFSYALIRRAREVAFVLGGWALLYIEEGRLMVWRNGAESPQKSG